MTGKWPTLNIDHKNGIGTDNRWENLREVSQSVNLQNRQGAQRNNKLGILGVSAERGRFVARIYVDGQTKRLGRFDTPELAHEAYLKAKRQFHAGNTL